MAWKPLVLSQVALVAAQDSVRVLTVIVHQCSGSTVGFPTTLNYATNPASFSFMTTERPTDGEYRTTTVPYTGTQSISSPLTTTIFPSDNLPGVVEIATPSGYRPPQPFITVSEQYTGTLQLSDATTLTTISPMGTAPGTYIVQYPASPGYVTITCPGDHSLSTRTTITTIQPSDSQPGTIIVQIPGALPLSSDYSFPTQQPQVTMSHSPTASARPSFSCDLNDASVIVTPSGNTYNLNCGSDAVGRLISESPASTDFNDCIAFCEANSDCMAWTYEGLFSGLGPGTCYVKGITDAGDDPYFTLAGPNTVSGLRRRAVDPPGLQFPSALSASTSDATVSELSSMTSITWPGYLPAQTSTGPSSTPGSSSFLDPLSSTDGTGDISSTSNLLQSQSSDPSSSKTPSLALESSRLLTAVLPSQSLSASLSDSLDTDSASSFRPSSLSEHTWTSTLSLSVVPSSSTGQISRTPQTGSSTPSLPGRSASPSPAATSTPPATESPQITSSSQLSSAQQLSSATEYEVSILFPSSSEVLSSSSSDHNDAISSTSSDLQGESSSIKTTNNVATTTSLIFSSSPVQFSSSSSLDTETAISTAIPDIPTSLISSLSSGSSLSETLTTVSEASTASSGAVSDQAASSAASSEALTAPPEALTTASTTSSAETASDFSSRSTLANTARFSTLSSVQDPSTSSESLSSTQLSFTYYVTSTREFTGSSPIAQPTTVTTISPSGTGPATVIVETELPSSSPSPLSSVASSFGSPSGTITTSSPSLSSPSTTQTVATSPPFQTDVSCANGYYGVASGSCPADNNVIITDLTGVQYYIGCEQDIGGATMTPSLPAANVTECFERCSTGTFSVGPCYGFTFFQGNCYFQTYNGPMQLDIASGVVAVIRPSFISGFVAPAASCTQTQLPSPVSTTTPGPSSSASLSSLSSLPDSQSPSSQSAIASPASDLSSSIQLLTTSLTTSLASTTSPSVFACPGLHRQDRTDVNGIQYRVACGRGTTGDDLNSVRSTSSFEECYAQCDARSGCQGFSWLGDEGNINGIGPGNCYLKSRGAGGGEIQFDGTDFGNPRLVSAIKLNQGLWTSSSSLVQSSSSSFVSPLGTVTQTTWGPYSDTTILTTIPYSGSESGTVVIGVPFTVTTITTTTTTPSPLGTITLTTHGTYEGTTTLTEIPRTGTQSGTILLGIPVTSSSTFLTTTRTTTTSFASTTQITTTTTSQNSSSSIVASSTTPSSSTSSTSTSTATSTGTAQTTTTTQLTASQVTTTQSSSLSTATLRPTYAAAAACPGVDNQVVAGAANVPYRIRCRYDNTGTTFAQYQSTTTSYAECFARCDNDESCLAFSWLGNGMAVNGNGVGNCYFKSRDTDGQYPVFFGEGTNTALLALIKLTPAQAASSAAPPLYTTSYTVYYPSGTMSQTYTSASVAPSGTARGTIVVARPIPTSPCLVDGYLSQINVVYRVDINLGNMTQLFTMELGPNPNPGATGQPITGINSIAYNSIDNYLYGTLRGPNPETLVRIGYDGSYQPLLDLPGNSSVYLRYFVGDIDANGQYYTASQQFSVWRYVQVNLNPNLPNYGQVVGTGATTLPSGGTVQDWAFVPGGGQNLYALAAQDNGVTTLNAFQLSTLTWVVVGTYPGSVVNRQQTIDASGTTQTPRWNALYASSNGYMYGTEGYSGQLWRFSIRLPLNATYISQGPRAADADGARCITNTTPL